MDCLSILKWNILIDFDWHWKIVISMCNQMVTSEIRE